MNRNATITAISEMQHRMVRELMREQSQTMVSTRLTPAQFHLLSLLHDKPGMPTMDAAIALGVKPNVASGLIQRVVDRGWVTRSSSSADGRQRLLSLTDSGQTLVNDAVQDAEHSFIARLARLSDVQVQQLHEIYRAIVTPQIP
ncbi:MarR family winged helix-turn-helix transcriptional regulator [Demequina capsici]|uniref:MarR family transcriptional regulator n=1 Tax=Demequina capsici TaxID=3075620 RepID=A0AA96F6G1_9MICO|nr:MarR family transcriptional regulator [Demequina sp. OYTSA14]WNM23605.1 MarR family transcriptional regulator [Demequina sp. OYTSA14]